MHAHSQREKCQQEIMAAFRAHDKQNTGTVPGAELANILNNFGERLTSGEGKFVEDFDVGLYCYIFESKKNVNIVCYVCKEDLPGMNKYVTQISRKSVIETVS